MSHIVKTFSPRKNTKIGDGCVKDAAAEVAANADKWPESQLKSLRSNFASTKEIGDALHANLDYSGPLAALNPVTIAKSLQYRTQAEQIRDDAENTTDSLTNRPMAARISNTNAWRSLDSKGRLAEINKDGHMMLPRPDDQLSFRTRATNGSNCSLPLSSRAEALEAQQHTEPPATITREDDRPRGRKDVIVLTLEGYSSIPPESATSPLARNTTGSDVQDSGIQPQATVGTLSPPTRLVQRAPTYTSEVLPPYLQISDPASMQISSSLAQSCSAETIHQEHSYRLPPPSDTRDSRPAPTRALPSASGEHSEQHPRARGPTGPVAATQLAAIRDHSPDSDIEEMPLFPSDPKAPPRRPASSYRSVRQMGMDARPSLRSEPRRSVPQALDVSNGTCRPPDHRPNVPAVTAEPSRLSSGENCPSVAVRPGSSQSPENASAEPTYHDPERGAVCRTPSTAPESTSRR